MRRLPPHHVPRPRLVERCLPHRLIVVEAAGGYGKSVLAAEVVAAWRSIGIEVVLEHGGASAALLAARLVAACRLAGLTAAAAAGEQAQQDPVSSVQALLAALDGERVAFVVDDGHHALEDAAALIGHLADHLAEDHRLIVLARQLPAGGERLRRGEALTLVSADLALDPAETLTLCRAGFGLQATEREAAELARATAGWTAATVLAAARASRTGASLGHVGDSVRSDAVREMLEEVIVALGRDGRRVLAQIAQLPLLDPEIVGLVADDPDFFQRARAAGLPLAPARGPWWSLPGPVRDHLSDLGSRDPATTRLVAEVYARRGELAIASELLLAAGDGQAVAQLLTAVPREALESLGLLELQTIVGQLPADVVARHPTLLLHLARQCELAVRFEERRRYLDLAEGIAGARSDALLARAVEVERASDLVREFRFDEAASRAREVLAELGPEEMLTRARALATLGRALCWQGDGERPDEETLRQAERALDDASELYRRMGRHKAAAGLVPYLAIWLDFAGGRTARALQRLDDALGVVDNQTWQRAFLLGFRAKVLADLGRHDECESAVADMERIADELDNDQLRAYACWSLFRSTAYRGDAARTVELVRRTEQHRDSWWVPASAEYLANAADALDLAGEETLARDYLRRGLDDPKDAAPLLVLVAAVIEARHGDPGLAEQRLSELRPGSIEPRERWRVQLMRAYAAFRRGDRAAGAIAAAAFEEAARLGEPRSPAVRERDIAEQLLVLAAETGLPAARALLAEGVPRSLSVLGRFELSDGGRRVELGGGQGTQLLKLVAASGGRVPAEQAIETLWPEVDPEAGRNRLRTVLNRLRAAAGEVLLREGEVLTLAPGVDVDLTRFLTSAERALALAGNDPQLAVAAARGAIARYRGEVLPDDRYDDWSEPARERARRAVLDLLDLCADQADREGDLDEIRRVVARTVELAPDDDPRLLRGARALLEQGRRGEALAVLARARKAFAELGLPAPPALVELEELIVS